MLQISTKASLMRLEDCADMSKENPDSFSIVSVEKSKVDIIRQNDSKTKK